MAGSIEAYQTAAGKRYRVRYRKPDKASTDKRGFRTKKEAQLFLASVTIARATGDSGTITDMWRGADRGTADRCVTVIDGTEVHSAGWLLMDSFDTLLTGDEVEVLAEWHEHSGHYWATTGHLACRPPAAPLIPDRPRPRRYRAVIDGREYTGTSPADVAVQRYGDDLQVVADQVERLCTVLDRDGATVIARIHVKEIS